VTIVSGGIKEIILASFYAIMFNGELKEELQLLENEKFNIIANAF
jgi:hypothetical protein